MKRFFFLLAAFSIFAPRALADILYINLNVAPDEIRAVKEAARLRGEKVAIYPQISDELEAKIENTYDLFTDAEENYFRCLRGHANDCTQLGLQFINFNKTLTELTKTVAPLGGDACR